MEITHAVKLMTTNNKNEFNRASQPVKVEKLPNLKLVKVPKQAKPLENSFKSQRFQQFERQVLLEQSPMRSQLILLSLIGVTMGAIVWACYAKIEQAIAATGKLEPTGTVKEVQSPVDGVVKAIYVADGQRVRKGDRLLSFDPTTARSQNAALMLVRNSLLQENQFYTSQINSHSETAPPPAGIQPKVEIISLTKNRAILVAENKLYRGQLGDAGATNSLNKEQIERLQSSQTELKSREAASRLAVAQLKVQLSQTDIELANLKNTLSMDRGILKDVAALAKVGAIPKMQFLKQQQQVHTDRTEVEKSIQEQARLKFAISEANWQAQNIIALDRKDLLERLAENNKSIAEIDTQLTKLLMENNKRLAEINSQLIQANLTLQYQDIKAPTSGIVFDMQVHNPGFVASSSQPILKIVPGDALTAKIFITNRDIGFVKEGMDVDVRIDSFPVGEFGDVKGKLMWIGSDALPPDDLYPFYRFPAKVRLQRQTLLVNGREVALHSGMGVSTNIKVRSRTVMSIFTDLFAKNAESLKFVR